MIETMGQGLLISVTFVVAMFLALEVGHRLGLRATATDPDAHKGTGTIEGAVLGLLGLILAFTLHGAQSRFDDRNQLIVQETNAIAAAYDRADLLPEDRRAAVRELLRAYVDARIAAFRAGSDRQQREPHRLRAVELQRQIWSQSELGCRTGRSDCAPLLLPTVNALADIATIRLVAQRAHEPLVIVVLLCILATCGAAMAGYSLAARRARRWMHRILYVASLVATVYVILDLEFPRRGLIRLSAPEVAFAELLDRMK